MTPREIILANIERTNPPRPGLTFSGGRANDMTWASLDPSPGYRQKRWTEGNREHYDDEWGNVWVRLVDGPTIGEIHTPALADWDKLDSLRLPAFDDPARYRSMREAFAKPTDRFKVAGLGGWVFANARYLRKMENYFADLLAEPDRVKALHARLAALIEAAIGHVARAGADAVMFWEDMGTQSGPLFSPAIFREFFKADYTRLAAAAHAAGLKVLMHSCGNNWTLMDDLLDVGIDVFQFDQPALYDMPALADKLRRRGRCLWSPVDIQKVLPTGDRAFIESETLRLCRTFEGGLILKDYPDLASLGLDPQWDAWAYDVIVKFCGWGS
ncbi:MAG: hypothetical protein NTV86_04655 [Planctomycetota bacterium]|nr:hypothetical protein [Planctomycetota bacterium]